MNFSKEDIKNANAAPFEVARLGSSQWLDFIVVDKPTCHIRICFGSKTKDDHFTKVEIDHYDEHGPVATLKEASCDLGSIHELHVELIKWLEWLEGIAK